jgi:hypothetical protein
VDDRLREPGRAKRERQLRRVGSGQPGNFVRRRGLHSRDYGTGQRGIRGAASNVTIQNLTIEKFSAQNQSGAIRLSTVSGTAPSGWLVNSNWITHNHGGGWAVTNGTQNFYFELQQGNAEGAGRGTYRWARVSK